MHEITTHTVAEGEEKIRFTLDNGNTLLLTRGEAIEIATATPPEEEPTVDYEVFERIAEEAYDTPKTLVDMDLAPEGVRHGTGLMVNTWQTLAQEGREGVSIATFARITGTPHNAARSRLWRLAQIGGAETSRVGIYHPVFAGGSKGAGVS